MKRATVLFVASFACLAARAEELRTTTLLRGGDMTSNAGRGGIVVRDVVGDSRPETIACASNSAFALGFNGTTYQNVWYSPEVACTSVAAGDVNGDGAVEVIVGAAELGTSSRGWVYVFDPTGNRQALASVQVSATTSVTAIAVGNVDNDPALEIVALTSGNCYILDAATLAVQWNAPWGGTSVAIGDVEGDGVNEVIINGGDGHVLNAAAQAYKWGYAGGFGTSMAAGDVDNDGKAEVIGGTSSQLRVIHGDTFTVNTYAVTASTVAVGDANADGQLEILAGGSFSNTIRGYSAAGTVLWTTADPSTFAVGTMVVGDPDGDGATEIVWADTSRGGLVIGTAGNNTTEFRGNNLRGFSWQTATGELDGAGDMELVAAGWLSILVRDVRTGATVGTIPVPGSNSTVYKVAIGQVDADAAREIVILVNTCCSGSTLYAYDGVTLALEWTSDPVFGTSLLAIRNLDGDAVDEIVVAAYNSNRFHVLNGASGFIQFNSPTLDDFLTDVAIGDLDGDTILDLAVTTYRSAYVYKTSDWTERKHIVPAFSFSVAAVAIMPGQLAVYWPYDSKLRTYDGTTLNEIRGCSVTSSPVDLAYATFGGRTRLVSSEDKLRFYAPEGVACPASDTLSVMARPVAMSFADVTGDGRVELIAGSSNGYTIAALGWNDEVHGDVDSDGVLTDGDIDALAAYLYGNGSTFHPAADVNGDTAIRPNDLFYLINYRKGTGAPPP